MGRKGKAKGRRGKTSTVLPTPWRLALVSLGCPKNLVDAEAALGALLGDAWAFCPDPAHADLIVINTCGFLESARDESRAVVEEMLALKGTTRGGGPKVVVMGCWVEQAGAAVLEALPTLDGAWGVAAYPHLDRLARALMAGGHDGQAESMPAVIGRRADDAEALHPMPETARLLVTPPSYTYLRISEGCDNRCAYCAIPTIRGPFHSRPLEAIIEEARAVVESGRDELVLVGQDTTRYGVDLAPARELPELLRALLDDTDARRIRLMYAHPAHLTDAVIALLHDEPRLCRYLEMPIQHCATPVLARMGRRYDRARVDDRLAALRGLTLRTTVMVGFPGETEADFEELRALVRSGAFQHLGAFRYSPEPKTPAAALPAAVAPEVAEARYDAIMQAQQAVAFATQDARVGAEVELLVDEITPEGLIVGRTDAEAPEVDPVVRINPPRSGDFSPGDWLHVRLGPRRGYDLDAAIIPHSKASKS